MFIKEISLVPQEVNSSEIVILAGAGVANYQAADVSATVGFQHFLVTTKVECYMKMGKGNTFAPTNDGTNQLLLANQSYRVGPVPAGYRLGFNGTTGGNIYLTPAA